MQIVSCQEFLANHGLDNPELNVLVPSQANYSAMLFQPTGRLEIGESGVRHTDQDLAIQQFSQFLQKAADDQAELAVTPEYSMPWEVLEQKLSEGISPPLGCLWVLGCEGIKLQDLNAIAGRLAPNVRVLYEDLVDDPARFLNGVAYVFQTRDADQDANQLVILLQFKTCPFGDDDHFEVNGMLRGSCLYTFGSNGSLHLATIICSDAFEFQDAHATAIYDRTILIHIQLNPNPRQDQFKLYRAKLMGFGGGQTELICLNWAQGIKFRNNGGWTDWNNIGGSCWYLNNEKIDRRDAILTENHKRGMYYTWINSLRCHGLFLNYGQALFCFTASKVAHIGVSASLSRRRGPQLTSSLTWNSENSEWELQQICDTGFGDSAAECGNASDCVCSLVDSNPINAERVIALSVGRVESGQTWYALNKLDSCCVDASEIVLRLTVCQDPRGEQFRLQRLRMLARLYAILNEPLPASIANFSQGFELEWSPASPHQNVKANDGKKATAIYVGETCNSEQALAIQKKAADYLGSSFSEPDEIVDARQRLYVWYRNVDGDDVAVSNQPYVDFGSSRTDSPFDIARHE